MTPAVLDRPGSLFADAAGRAEHPAAGDRLGDGSHLAGERPGGGSHVADGRVTLERLLNSALHQARTHGSAECPVCHARVSSTRAREAGAAGEAVAAECGGCGSRLS